jgi:hypothetical protein
VAWLEMTENTIRQAEPVDLTGEIEVIEAKYNKFRVSTPIKMLLSAVSFLLKNVKHLKKNFQCIAYILTLLYFA